MQFGDDLPRRPRKAKRKYRTALCMFGFLGALLMTLAFLPGTATRGGAAIAAEADRQQPNLLPADAREKPKFDKLIGDIKVLHGKPPMVIDLGKVFAGEEMAQGGRLEFEVKHNVKPGVVEPRIDGDQETLTLKWLGEGKSEITIHATNLQTGECLASKFEVEVWKPDYGTLLLTVIGGLGIFLLGMKNMSEGLQAVAGAGLRRLIGAVTDNLLMATGVGTLVTMLIQSSSITTVMVVGFVNSGFMTLSQAVGVIMGANIGTTITGWILVLQIGKYGLPIVGAAAFAYLFSKRDRFRYVAMATMGLGMVFFGLELMKDGFTVVKNLPAFDDWFRSFSADSYLGVLKCAAVGCVLTFIVQSSSATLGITISLAVTGVIPFETAGALVLGENIGTTITAWLASLGATTNAKRAAYFHILFNMLGVLWITAIFLPFYAPLVKSIVGVVTDPETGKLVPRNVTEAIAVTHTLFNVANTILFMGFARRIAALLEWAIPERAVKEKPHLTSLDVRMLETSAIAIEQSRLEVLRMGVGCEKMMGWIREIVAQEVPDQKLVQKAFHREEILDAVESEIVTFMTHLLSGNVPLEVATEARRQLRMADEYESVGDYLISILKSHLKLQSAGLRLAETDQAKLLELHEMVAEYLAMVDRGYEQRQPEVVTKAHSQGTAITHQVKELRKEFLAKMSEEKLDPQIVLAFNGQINAYRRVREHVVNVAEALAGEK